MLLEALSTTAPESPARHARQADGPLKHVSAGHEQTQTADPQDSLEDGERRFLGE